MYKITPWHYYNTKFTIDEVKLAPNFCGGDSRDELQALDGTKVTEKSPPDTVKNLIVKLNTDFKKEILKPFQQNLEHLYVLCAASEVDAEALNKCDNLRGLYVSNSKNFKKVPGGFFKNACNIKKLVINYTAVNLEPGMFTGLQNLEELDMQENSILELKSGVLNDLPKLQKLILARNKIKSIDTDAFAGNRCLIQIDLSHNALVKWEIVSLPSNSSLKYLKLSNNKIETTVSLGAFTQLFQLSLDYNKIIELNKNIFGDNMDRLDYLALNNNKISNVQEDTFDLKTLRVLLLDHNKLQHLPEKIFAQLPELQQLSLDHNDFTTLNMDVFASVKSLSNLVLSCSNITDLTNSSKSGAENLSNLHLDDNNLTKLKSHVFSGFSGVTVLELNDCKIEELEADWCAGLTTLKQLNLSGNMLKELKSNTFKSLKLLKSLNLAGNQIALIEKGAFSDLDALTTLNMCDNRLENLCDYMFQDLHCLRSLALGNNEITQLSNNSLGCSPCLIYLDLSENRINKIEELAFANIKHLVTLDLGYNGLTQWPNLSQNSDLGKLILSYNYLNEFDDNVFIALTNLTQLHIDNNNIQSIDPLILEQSAVREFNYDEDKLDNNIVEKIKTVLQVRQIRRRVSVRIEPREKCRKVFM